MVQGLGFRVQGLRRFRVKKGFRTCRVQAALNSPIICYCRKLRRIGSRHVLG